MVYHCFTDVGIWQVWTKLGLQKSGTTLGEIVGLHNCAVADKGSIDEYYRDLGKSGITKITYNFRRDRTTVQLQTKDQLTSTIGIWASLDRVCVMASGHSCGENRKVNEAFRG